MVRPNTERSEDTIIALDFEPKNVNMKKFKGALSTFFAAKRNIDKTDRFNLVLFRANPSYLEDFTFKAEYLLSLIDEDVKHINTIPVENVIFMSLTFLIEVYKRVGNKFFRIIIVTDQDMKPVTSEFMVKDLLDITKEMPVYIDVLRINVQEDKDPNKAKLDEIIKWSKGGELIYVEKQKKLERIMVELADKKFNEDEGVFELIKEIKIPDKYAGFFENMSEDLKTIQNHPDVKCMACFKTELPGNKLFTCPSCGNSIMHEVCWAHWSKTANIGVRHVFRCPICFSLLRLPRAFIEDILGAVVEEEEELSQAVVQNVVVADQTERLMEKDKEAPKLIESLLDSIM
nr:hypothetical protein [Candidatus Sigynarchaeota archaeon]